MSSESNEVGRILTWLFPLREFSMSILLKQNYAKMYPWNILLLRADHNVRIEQHRTTWDWVKNLQVSYTEGFSALDGTCPSYTLRCYLVPFLPYRWRPNIRSVTKQKKYGFGPSEDGSPGRSVIPRKVFERQRKLNKWTAWTNKRIHRNHLLFLRARGSNPGPLEIVILQWSLHHQHKAPPELNTTCI